MALINLRLICSQRALTRKDEGIQEAQCVQCDVHSKWRVNCWQSKQFDQRTLERKWTVFALTHSLSLNQCPRFQHLMESFTHIVSTYDPYVSLINCCSVTGAEMNV